MGQETHGLTVAHMHMRNMRVGGSSDPAPIMPTHGDSYHYENGCITSEYYCTIPHLGIMIGPV